MSSSESSESSTHSQQDPQSDSSSSNSSSSEQQTPFKVTTDQQLRLQFRNAIILGANNQNYAAYPKTDKELEVFQQEVATNSQLQQRLTIFDTTQFDEMPAGLVDFSQIMSSKSLRCTKCLSLFFNPISFIQCGHSYCPTCLYELLLKEKVDVKMKDDKSLTLAQHLINEDYPCPECKAISKTYKNRPLAQAVQSFIQGNPFEIVGANQYLPKQPTCSICKAEMSYQKKIQKHVDDEKELKLGFVTDFCIYCRRHICPACQEKNDIDQCGQKFVKKIGDYTAEDVSIIKDVESDLFCTMNFVEQEYLFSQMKREEVFQKFLDQIKRYYYLPVTQFIGSQTPIDKDMLCCSRCFSYLFDVACHYIRAQMRSDKPKCLCGSGCRLQFYNLEHAKECQHAGPGTRGDQTISIWG
ncbi:Conserved_hypothetical protein [Hexamita inflata]|uniref:RING-type domain-containing protein n=1 Tax=Hexamita inflata TaxID=28002 RepID=A0AA86R480_9EUKA|nr:Conserved hypothetical protein [Hexamita inflata]CAI9961940.1 Conserved hypothetical protein [Hexamita inflata]